MKYWVKICLDFFCFVCSLRHSKIKIFIEWFCFCYIILLVLLFEPKIRKSAKMRWTFVQFGLKRMFMIVNLNRQSENGDKQLWNIRNLKFGKNMNKCKCSEFVVWSLVHFYIWWHAIYPFCSFLRKLHDANEAILMKRHLIFWLMNESAFYSVWAWSRLLRKSTVIWQRVEPCRIDHNILNYALVELVITINVLIKIRRPKCSPRISIYREVNVLVIEFRS